MVFPGDAPMAGEGEAHAPSSGPRFSNGEGKLAIGLLMLSCSGPGDAAMPNGAPGRGWRDGVRARPSVIKSLMSNSGCAGVGRAGVRGLAAVAKSLCAAAGEAGGSGCAVLGRFGAVGDTVGAREVGHDP